MVGREERLKTAEQALEALRTALAVQRPGELERDATLRRLAFAAEPAWRAAQACLRAVEGVDVASPKAAVRACVETGRLTPEPRCDNEDLAGIILERARDHERTLSTWLGSLR